MIEVLRANQKRPLISTPASPACRACVVIPVRDEAANLVATLRALAEQVDLEGRPLDRSRFEVIVLANNCRDGSADLARRFGALEQTLALHVAEAEIPGDFAHVGTARRLLMDEACRRLLDLGRGRGVIISTDGDTRASPEWLAATFDEVGAGADAVGGDIRTDRAGRSGLGRAARDAYLADVAYRRLVDELEARLNPDPADPWPRHYHHTGASLAVTAEAYRRVGGLPPLPTSEDLAFVSALRRFDLILRHSPRVRVVTSARRVGRAEGGMADTLRRWSVDGPSSLVEHPTAIEARAVLGRRLRDLWKTYRIGGSPITLDTSLDGLAGPLQLCRERLALTLKTAPTFGLFREAIGRDERRDPDRQKGMIDVLEAIAILRSRLSVIPPHASGRKPTSTLHEEIDPVRFLSTPAQVA